MDIVPIYSGNDPLGCSSQVHKARKFTTSISQLQRDDLFLVRRDIFSFSDPIQKLSLSTACQCRISENGCIDPSDCTVQHPLFAVPKINRWCDYTTANLYGAAHSIFWSGWARPAALSLSNRYTTVAEVRDILSRSHQRTKHMSHRFDYSIEYDSALGVDVLNLYPKSFSEKEFPKAKDLLLALPADLRFGRHGVPQSSLNEIPEIFDESYSRP
jgi:hypothetical protein